MHSRHTKLVLPVLPPRAKSLNAALRSLPGGRMTSPRDFNRQRVKSELRKELQREEA